MPGAGAGGKRARIAVLIAPSRNSPTSASARCGQAKLAHLRQECAGCRPNGTVARLGRSGRAGPLRSHQRNGAQIRPSAANAPCATAAGVRPSRPAASAREPCSATSAKGFQELRVHRKEKLLDLETSTSELFFRSSVCNDAPDRNWKDTGMTTPNATTIDTASRPSPPLGDATHDLLKKGLAQRLAFARVGPLRPGQPRLVRPRLYSVARCPPREDLATPGKLGLPHLHPRAIEAMPEGCIAVADSHGDHRRWHLRRHPCAKTAGAARRRGR